MPNPPSPRHRSRAADTPYIRRPLFSRDEQPLRPIQNVVRLEIASCGRFTLYRRKHSRQRELNRLAVYTGALRSTCHLLERWYQSLVLSMV
jgi:hypothetical protein